MAKILTFSSSTLEGIACVNVKDCSLISLTPNSDNTLTFYYPNGQRSEVKIDSIAAITTDDGIDLTDDFFALYGLNRTPVPKRVQATLHALNNLFPYLDTEEG